MAEHDDAPREWPVPWQPVWGEASGLGSRVGTWVVHGALAAAARLPEPLLAPLLSVLATLGTVFGRRRTRAARVFLRQALGDLDERELARLTHRAWAQLLRVSVDCERLARVRPERLREHFEVHASPAARALLASGRGMLMVSGHLGNWEAAFACLPALDLHPVYGVAKPPKNLYLSRALQASRERWGVRLLSRKGAMADAPVILKAGGVLGLVIDQRTSGRALLAPFFGRPARCERAPAVLLKRQRVPVVIVSCLMQPEPLRYRLEFHEVLEPDEWARRDVEAIVTRINQGLERLIRAHPEQYVWIHDRYRDTPDALAPDAPARILRSPPNPT
jgi:KDO2-lipid IV(A) lauroyltransferase